MPPRPALEGFSTATYEDTSMELIGPLQARVMSILWREGKGTVTTVHKELNQQTGAKPLAYTTVLTVMRNLARRKIVSQENTGCRSHLFTPLIGKEELQRQAMRFMRETYFAGDQAAFVKAAGAA